VIGGVRYIYIANGMWLTEKMITVQLLDQTYVSSTLETTLVDR
jgi:hypothetical protein